MKTRMKGSDFIIRFLEKNGIATISGIPGGTNLPLYHSLAESSIRHVLARHEQGAGFISQGMARSTGKTAVCFATSGPGVTNLLTAIADAKADSVPIVAITGQVSSRLIGTDAFQEVDTYGLTLPITKHNYLVRKAAELPEILCDGFTIAGSGRHGPVVIDVPKDIQMEEADFGTIPIIPDFKKPPEASQFELKQAAEWIGRSKKPVLLIGGGVSKSGASESARHLSGQNGIPAVCTLMGLGCYQPEDPNFIGMVGMHGARYTNLVMREADLLIAIGVRFDDRATGNPAHFCPDASVIHVDIDRAEIGKIRTPGISITSDAKTFLEKLIPLIHEDGRTEWNIQIRKLKAENPFRMPDSPDHPLQWIRKSAEALPNDCFITTDVGQHQMWTAQGYPFRRPGSLLTSGGLGTMGFGLPAAIGAALGNPGKRVVCFTGDGSLLMNIQELATLADWNLDVKVLVFDNGHLGLVRQQQELFYDKNYIACQFPTRTDFAAAARAFGIPGINLNDEPDPHSALNSALKTEGPMLIVIPVSETENVLPMVPPGGANHMMIGG